jgi:hypothetical protein
MGIHQKRNELRCYRAAKLDRTIVESLVAITFLFSSMNISLIGTHACHRFLKPLLCGNGTKPRGPPILHVRRVQNLPSFVVSMPRPPDPQRPKVEHTRGL